MTRDPAAVPLRAAAMGALRLMRDGGFDRVPVWRAAGRWGSSPTATSLGRQNIERERQRTSPGRGRRDS